MLVRAFPSLTKINGEYLNESQMPVKSNVTQSDSDDTLEMIAGSQGNINFRRLHSLIKSL